MPNRPLKSPDHTRCIPRCPRFWQLRGVSAAISAVSQARCQFHLQQNAGQFVTRQEARKTVAATLRTIFNAPDKIEAERLLQSALEAWRKEHPKLAQWAEVAVPESLTVFDFPAAHRVRLRTTNGLERINRELRRRTRVASIFPNPDSCLRLISALLVELDDE
jgi:transposase-like protein